MTKIRAGALKLKPKRTPDFKKKTAKVGKKVQRSNVTKIAVATKRIHVPVQSIDAVDNTSINAVIDSAINQLQHYNSKNRLLGVSELIRAFSSRSNILEKRIGN
jgi:hypothetical protein